MEIVIVRPQDEPYIHYICMYMLYVVNNKCCTKCNKFMVLYSPATHNLLHRTQCRTTTMSPESCQDEGDACWDRHLRQRCDCRAAPGSGPPRVWATWRLRLHIRKTCKRDNKWKYGWRTEMRLEVRSTAVASLAPGEDRLDATVEQQTVQQGYHRHSTYMIRIIRDI